LAVERDVVDLDVTVGQATSAAKQQTRPSLQKAGAEDQAAVTVTLKDVGFIN
jgi:hypothetical protein